MSSFLKIKSILIALGVTILAGIISAFTPILSLSLPFASLTFDLSPKLTPGTLCMMVYTGKSLGWPLVFLQYVSSSSCSSKIIFNPVGLFVNFAIFLLVIYLLKRKELFKSNSIYK